MKNETAYCNILFMFPLWYYDHYVNDRPLIGAKEMKGNTVDSFYSSLFCTACPPHTTVQLCQVLFHAFLKYTATTHVDG